MGKKDKKDDDKSEKGDGDKKEKKEKKEKKDKKEKKEKKDKKEEKSEKEEDTEKKDKKDKKGKKDKKEKEDKEEVKEDEGKDDKKDKKKKGKDKEEPEEKDEGKGDKKKKVGFKDELEEPSNKVKEASKSQGKKVNTEYLIQLFSGIDLQLQIKGLCTEIIEKKNSNLRDKIFQVDGTFPAPLGEQNHKVLISKWNADITKSQLLNKLVKPNDTVKAKNEIQTKLKMLHQNPENFRVSDGFKTIEAALGVGKVDNIIKDKKLEEELVITRREKTPTYTERKKVLQAEWTERMKDTQNLIKSVSNVRKEIRIKNKARKAEEQKKTQQQIQIKEQKLKTEEQEKEVLRAQKLQEIEEKRKKVEEEKQKQLLQMKEYTKKFDLK